MAKKIVPIKKGTWEWWDTTLEYYMANLGINSLTINFFINVFVKVFVKYLTPTPLGETLTAAGSWATRNLVWEKKFIYLVKGQFFFMIESLCFAPNHSLAVKWPCPLFSLIVNPFCSIFYGIFRKSALQKKTYIAGYWGLYDVTCSRFILSRGCV